MSHVDRTTVAARALAHPARLRTLAMLRGGELCVCQVQAVLELAASTVSAHLRELKLAGLLDERKAGRWVYVRLAEDAAMRPWLDLVLAEIDGDPQVRADAERVAQLHGMTLEALCRLGFQAARAAACCERRE